MAGKLKIGRTVERGIPVVTVDYGVDLMFRAESADEISSQMVNAYEEILADNNPANESCVVVIESESAGSPLVRALFKLYERVTAEGNQLICVNYPDDYIHSLASLGLPSLGGFSLMSSKQNALSKLLSEERKTEAR